jgi:hypothetical protein
MSALPHPLRLGSWLIAGTIATAGLALVSVLFVKLASSPNSTERLHLPARIDAFTQQDGLAYPLHAALGTAFNLLPGTAEAAGIQWLKAADHVGSPVEMASVARGITRARDRATDPVAFTQHLCAVADTKNPRVQQALGAAELSCGARR